MNKDQGTPRGVVRCVAATSFCLLLFASFFAPPPLLAGETARPIASMTLQDRQRLPDNTVVKLKSGRTATLGVLRAEHQARMERFARATALGQMAAGRLSKPSPNSTELNRAATQKIQPATGPATGPATAPAAAPATKSSGANQVQSATGTGTGSAMKTGGPSKVATGTRISEASSSIARPFFSVPFQIVSTPLAPIPKDYMDFCKSADATACIYLPANTTLTAFQGDPTTSTSFAWDEDALITDAGVCKFDGGLVWGGGCLFYYPVIHVVDFKPTGTLSTTAACDAPSKYLLDSKGAVKVSYPYPSVTFATGGTPITCVAQVWISK